MPSAAAVAVKCQSCLDSCACTTIQLTPCAAASTNALSVGNTLQQLNPAQQQADLDVSHKSHKLAVVGPAVRHFDKAVSHLNVHTARGCAGTPNGHEYYECLACGEYSDSDVKLQAYI